MAVHLSSLLMNRDVSVVCSIDFNSTAVRVDIQEKRNKYQKAAIIRPSANRIPADEIV